MIKVKSLKKQLTKLALNWIIRISPTGERKEIRKDFKEDPEYKECVIEQYLKSHPKVKKQYEEKKKMLFKLKLGLATTLIGVSTLAGAYTLAPKQTQENAIKQEKELNNDFLEQDLELVEENKHEAFFEEVRNVENTRKRDELITNYTKQIIVEMYNKEHQDNPITVDRLQTLILGEYVLKREDKLGNYTYERIPQNEIDENSVKIGNIYDFRIDGNTVAVFDSNGGILKDGNIEKQDMSFRDAIELVKQSEKLKDIYKYPSNINQEKEVEQAYAQVVENYLGNDISVAKNEKER